MFRITIAIACFSFASTGYGHGFKYSCEEVLTNFHYEMIGVFGKVEIDRFKNDVEAVIVNGKFMRCPAPESSWVYSQSKCDAKLANIKEELVAANGEPYLVIRILNECNSIVAARKSTGE